MGRKRYPWVKLWFEVLADPKMRRLTIAERGIWYELLLLAGQSPERGKLLLTKDVPMTMDDIARSLNLREDERIILESAIGKLEKLNCLEWNHESIVITHFHERQDIYPSDLERSSTQYSPDKLGINSQYSPNKLGINSNKLPLDEEVDVDKETDKDTLTRSKARKHKFSSQFFQQFWDAYPRKRNKGQAEKAFEKAQVDEQLLSVILAALERAKKSPEWLKDDGQFVPYPATWLNTRGWEDEYAESRRRPPGKLPTAEELERSWKK